MHRFSKYLAVFVLFLFVVGAEAQSQKTRRPPMLTNDDVLSPSSSRTTVEEPVIRTEATGTPLRNAREVLESALSKISEVKSSRTRMQMTSPAGQREVFIESVKPDRMRVSSADAEMIAIGRKFYLKTGGTWTVQTAPATSSTLDSGFDVRTFMRQMISKGNVRITGKILGSQSVDGVETIAYEFQVTEGSDSGTLQLSVGKQDGFIRLLSANGSGMNIVVSFSNINEPLSIEAPM
jgi:hypothetical protein